MYRRKLTLTNYNKKMTLADRATKRGINMKLDNTSHNAKLRAALSAIALIAAAVLIREGFELSREADSVGNREIPALETDWRNNPRALQNTLTIQENAQFAELQQRYSFEELNHVFNPPTSDEREQALLENPLTPYDHANFQFDGEWSEFVDSLNLSPEVARLVRDIWVESEARFIELGIAAGNGTLETGIAAKAQEEVNNRLYSRLYEILSPEQLTAFLDHEERLQTDFLASSEALQEELIDMGYSGLILAAIKNDLPTTQAYLASGINPNRFTSDGLSALRQAAINNNPEMLRALINAGADVNLAKMPGNISAMWDAVNYGNTDAARLLIEYGADPNHRTNPDNPLSALLSSAARNGHTEMVRLLLNAGADASGIAGESALVNAIEFSDREMEQMLIDAGANAQAPQVTERRDLFNLGRRLGLVDD